NLAGKQATIEDYYNTYPSMRPEGFVADGEEVKDEAGTVVQGGLQPEEAEKIAESLNITEQITEFARTFIGEENARDSESLIAFTELARKAFDLSNKRRKPENQVTFGQYVLTANGRKKMNKIKDALFNPKGTGRETAEPAPVMAGAGKGVEPKFKPDAPANAPALTSAYLRGLHTELVEFKQQV